MSLTTTISAPESRITLGKVWESVKKIKFTLEYFAAAMIVATFLLLLTRACISPFWYVVLVLFSLATIFDKFKNLIIKEDAGTEPTKQRERGEPNTTGII
jgi:MFS-type transporter involved in bile tolerance (Atg22 family)